MAEAHDAVAFSFRVTDEGVDVAINNEALRAVWTSGKRSWRKRFTRFKNHAHNTFYPASLSSLVVGTVGVIGIYKYTKYDPSVGVITWVKELPKICELNANDKTIVACCTFTSTIWLAGVIIWKNTLGLLFKWHGWMFDPHGKLGFKSKMWLGLVKLLQGRNPKHMSYQGLLPHLPVPTLNDTMDRYILSVKPFLPEDKYERMEKLVEEFKSGIGKRLQRYLTLKSWWATNYVTDWWEEYVYLRGRSPIMVNSNFYGIDAIMTNPTNLQAARAANITRIMLNFRMMIEREEMPPILVNKTVPLCSAQYERQFNTTRIPGVETDVIQHVKDSRHIAVYHKGCFYKVYIHYKGKLLSASQIEIMLQKILDGDHKPALGEEHLAALTAGDRVPWAEARQEFFSKGVNKTSLDAIEKAAFMLVLDDEPRDFDNNDPTLLNKFGLSLLYGKCYDRWFDKSFNLIVSSNGKVGFNGEHSWADAPIMAHLWEYTMYEDLSVFRSPRFESIYGTQSYRYSEDGHCVGEVEYQPPNPIRLSWELPDKCIDVIEKSLKVAQKLGDDVDLYLLTHDAYGKGFMKKAKLSPDAYIQLALQLTYFRDAGHFCLTYEASMTRLFKEGRTETVRACTVDSSNFVKAMVDETKLKTERVALMRKAAAAHQDMYKYAMTGMGIDRHLFCLYVISKYLGVDSPFLKEVLSEPWRLSTSQTPCQQMDKFDLSKHPEFISAGGGFGPVADDGYGVSYIIAGEDVIFFHVSSKKSSPITDSKQFAQSIAKSLADIQDLFN